MLFILVVSKRVVSQLFPVFGWLELKSAAQSEIKAYFVHAFGWRQKVTENTHSVGETGFPGPFDSTQDYSKPENDNLALWMITL